jgi:hypothetical protein
MNERNNTPDTSMERRQRQGAAASMWGELVVEMSWRPSDKPKVESDGWLRANGYLPERRQGR